MAAAAAKPKRLPGFLQEYKRKVRGLDFKGKVKAYFDCAPYIDDYGGQKKEIVYNTFSRIEKEEFSRLYQPVYLAIDRYGDRVRAIYERCNLYSLYIEMQLRRREATNYTADFLNRALQKTEEVIEASKEESVKEHLSELQERLLSYRKISVPSVFDTKITIPTISDNKAKRYEVDNKQLEKKTMNIIENLKAHLSLLKCYLDSLKEFLDWVGTPELLPEEFEQMEKTLQAQYTPVAVPKQKNPSEKDFPLFLASSPMVEDFLSIDYKKLPRTVDIFGDKNLWAYTYRSFFTY